MCMGMIRWMVQGDGRTQTIVYGIMMTLSVGRLFLTDASLCVINIMLKSSALTIVAELETRCYSSIIEQHDIIYRAKSVGPFHTPAMPIW